jgi:CHAT domain-containing protein
VGRARGGIPGDDGRLELHEILDLNTTSPLIFLSGCETALGSSADGPFAKGDDESLSRAFIDAGAGNVVATLWRVNDRGAVRIAESFYRRLRDGMSVPGALAMTQRNEIASGNDLTWAAYSITVAGD